MRKRWEFDPLPYVFAWFFGGLVLWIVATTLWDATARRGPHHRLGTVGIVGLCLWLGPFALVFLRGIIRVSARALWGARPRRIAEPVTDDLRKISAQSQQDQGER